MKKTGKAWYSMCLLVLLPVVAGGAAGDAGAVVDLGSFEVLGGPEVLVGLPGSGYRVEGEAIGNFGIDNVHGLLDQVPGAYFREEDGHGLLANVSLRGVDTSRSAKLTLMEDGIPTAPAPYSAPSAYYTPSVGRMSAVEVLKGGSQVKYGPHTTGGVINYLSTPLPGRDAGLLRMSAGEDGQRQVHGWIGQRHDAAGGALDLLVEGFYRGSDGFQRIAEGGSYGGSGATGFDAYDLMVKGGWTAAEGRHRWEAKIGYSEVDADISYLGLAMADYAADAYQRYAASRLDNLATEHSRSYIRYQYAGTGNWMVNWTSYWNTFHRNWYKLHDIRDLDVDGDGVVEGAAGNAPVRVGLSQAVAGAANGMALEALRGERAAELRVRANNRDHMLAGSEVQLQGRFETATWEHQPLLGLRYHRDRVRRLQWHDLFSQAADGSWSAPQTSARGSDGNRRQQTESTALFMENEMRAGKWIIKPGARVEWIDLRLQNFSSDGANAPGPVSTADLELWSAGIAATYLLSADSAVFGNIYRGFSVPSPSAAINSGVDEETSVSAELGYRLRNASGAGLSLEIVAFVSRFDDLIVIDNIGSGNTGDGMNPVTENVGRVDSHGLEWIVRADLAGGKQPYRIPLSLTATWTVAELNGDTTSLDNESIFAGGRDGDRVPYIPEWSGRLGIGLETDRWEAGVALIWRDSTFSTAAPVSGQTNPQTGAPDARFGKIDSVFLVDAFVSYAVNANLKLFANASNLTDRTHLTSRHPHGARPGPPRQISAGFAYRF